MRYEDTKQDFWKKESSSKISNFSFDPNGTIFEDPAKGQFNVIKYLCSASSSVVVTVAIRIEDIENKKREVFTYAINDNNYKDLIDDGTALRNLLVFSKNIIRCIEFESAVKQVISYRQKGDTDKIYILLWNGKIMRISATMLENPDIPDSALSFTNVFGHEEEEDYKGFSVFGKNICVFGNDGLLMAHL